MGGSEGFVGWGVKVGRELQERLNAFCFAFVFEGEGIELLGPQRDGRKQAEAFDKWERD
jgi:hypothetical protein